MHLTIRVCTRFCLVILAMFAFPQLWGQGPEYARVKVRANAQQLRQMASNGISLDHVAQSDQGIIGEFSGWELDQMDALGLSYQIIHADASGWYAARNANATPASLADAVGAAPAGFRLGSMGGYLTFAEAITDLDSMAQMYPNLVAPRDSIGVSHEGRTIWMVKLSDNPQLDENEPEVLYVGLHHAREPMSLMNLMYFMFYALEQYGTDPKITELLNTRELYFVPVLNPDGYVYNQATNPNGGGLWRKNRRNNGNNDFGVDLNRNYSYEWGFDNVGSSFDPAASTYRGPAPFSEPETEALRRFCLAHEFRTGLNHHAWGEQVIYPWGYDGEANLPEEEHFHRHGHFLTEASDYLPGNPDQTIGYAVNGGADDWMYGDSTKGEMRTFSPEIGSNLDWFWPPIGRILPLCEEMVEANLRVACLAGGCIDLKSEIPCDLEGSEAWLPIRYTNLGLDSAGAFSAEFVSSDPNVIAIPLGQLNFGSLASGQSTRDSFRISLAASLAKGEEIRGLIRTVHPGNIVQQDSVKFRYGVPEIIFAEDGEMGLGRWNGTWSITDEHVYSGNYAITESPYAPYAPSANRNLILQNPIDLEQYTKVRMEFYATWQIERDWDYVTIEASDNGINYHPLSGTYTRPGSGNTQPSGEPLFEGNRFLWVKEKFDLSDFDGRQVFLRFRFASNAFQERDGFYWDDLRITGYEFTVGQNPEDPFTALRLLPNPAHAEVSVAGAFTAAGAVHLEIYSPTGKMLRSRPIHPGMALNVQDLAAGIYFYRFRNGDTPGKLHKLILH
ncbi:MAG: M14 family zinc carboxypeptidase [Bacteroidota bacterium]